MTASPTTVGETNTQPCVLKLHSASDGFAAADEGRWSAWIDASGTSRNARTATRVRFGMANSAPFWDGGGAESVTPTSDGLRLGESCMVRLLLRDLLRARKFSPRVPNVAEFFACSGRLLDALKSARGVELEIASWATRDRNAPTTHPAMNVRTSLVRANLPECSRSRR